MTRRPRWRYYHSMDHHPSTATPHRQEGEHKELLVRHSCSSPSAACQTDLPARQASPSPHRHDGVVLTCVRACVRVCLGLAPCRLDGLPFGAYHALVVAALGITWMLDGLEVTVRASLLSWCV